MNCMCMPEETGMQAPASPDDDNGATELHRACALIAALPVNVDMSDADLRGAMASLVRIFSARNEMDRTYLPLPAGSQVTATECMLTVSALLRSLNLQLFELGMWQSFTGRH